MTPPSQDETDIAAKIAETIQIWATIAGSLAIVWGFLAKIWKPYLEWRRAHYARMVRDVLAPELKQLHEIIERDDGCAGRMEAVLRGMRAMYGDHDHLVEIATDNRDRLDETNDFLDAIGFSSDRREDLERRKMIDVMVGTLRERRRERRRDPDNPLYHPPREEL